MHLWFGKGKLGDIMKKIMLNDKEYVLLKDYRDGFDISEVTDKLTEYFDGYDYILGDWAYGKLRLKGFCDKGNKLFRDINDIDTLDDYIKDNCAYNCKHFVLKKVSTTEKKD